jgi:hypothetical protein
MEIVVVMTMVVAAGAWLIWYRFIRTRRSGRNTGNECNTCPYAKACSKIPLPKDDRD